MSAMIGLITIIIALLLWTVNDTRQYRVFKLDDSSASRQRFYLLWTIQGFILLVGASMFTAWVLGRGLPILTLPPELQPLAASLRPSNVEARGEGGRMGMAFGLALGFTASLGLLVWRMRRALRPIVGDVDALIPRNRREMLVALPLCLNAGFSEELFFRLALPLLIANVTGSVVVGLAASAVIFGLIHAYQGWKGVIATTFVGVFLTFVYLKSGSLVHPMALHALIDVIALIVRPALAARLGGAGRRSRDADVSSTATTERF